MNVEIRQATEDDVPAVAALEQELVRGDAPVLALAPMQDSAHTQGKTMNITLAAGPLVALIAGVLILIVPRLLNYIVALYLIIIGLLGLFGPDGRIHTGSSAASTFENTVRLDASAPPPVVKRIDWL